MTAKESDISRNGNIGDSLKELSAEQREIFDRQVPGWFSAEDAF